MAELGAGAGSEYPTAVDTKQTFANTANPLADDSSRMDSEVLNDALDAIVKVETELGVNPSGADATVAARLNATETKKTSFVTNFQQFDPVWPDASTKKAIFYIGIPHDYDSGNVVFKIFRRSAITTDTAVMRKSSFRFRDATAFLQIDNGVNIDFTPGDANSHILSAAIAAANFQAGDTLRLDIERLGADAGDTMAAQVAFDGGWVEYTAKRLG